MFDARAPSRVRDDVTLALRLTSEQEQHGRRRRLQVLHVISGLRMPATLVTLEARLDRMELLAFVDVTLDGRS